MGFFVARGYIGGAVIDRSFGPGVLEIPAHAPSYDLPNLAHGVATRAIARGVLEAVDNVATTTALGIFAIRAGPDLRPGRRRFVRGTPPVPEQLRGQIRRGRSFAEDVDPAVFFRITARRVSPVYPHPDQLRGGVHRRRGSPVDYVPNAPFIISIRIVRPVYPHPDQLRGRIDRRRGFSQDIAPDPLARQPHRISRPVYPHPDQLRGRIMRGGPRSKFGPFPAEAALLQRLDVRAAREISMLVDLDVYAASGYRLIARAIETGIETVLGMSPVVGAALPDGRYLVRVECDDRFWRGARFATEYPIEISGGAVVAALPDVRGLTYVVIDSTVYVTFTLDAQATSTPADFAAWTDTMSPVDTSGAPAATIAAVGVGGYTFTLPASPTTFYVGVAARLGSQIGPVATIAIVPEDSVPDAPNASARIPDGSWKE